MAVQFNSDSFTVTSPTGVNPVEDWLETHDEIIDVLQCRDAELTAGKSHGKVLELLRNMMPDVETAKKMTLGVVILHGV